MVRIFFITLALLTSIATAFGQGLCEMCESFEQVNCTTINNKMLMSPQLMAQISGPILLQKLIGKIDFVETVNTDHAPSRDKLKEVIKRYLSKGRTFERTVHIKDDDSVISLYQRQLNNNLYEYMLVIIDSSDVTAVNLIGTLTPQELGQCTFL